MNNRFHIFLDIDSVMVVGHSLYSNKTHPEYDNSPFDKNCVKILNEIIEVTNPVIIISSDWKFHNDLDKLNKIFKANKINSKVSDVTSTLWGVRYTKFSELENCRADEINLYVKEREVQNYVAIDDLNLKELLPDNTFVRTPRSMEGIKQSNVKEKVINIFKLSQDEKK